MRCEQLGCKNTATWKVYWPGNSPIPTCDDHKKLAVSAGAVIGVLVHTEEIHDTGGEGESNRQDTKGEVH